MEDICTYPQSVIHGISRGNRGISFKHKLRKMTNMKCTDCRKPPGDNFRNVLPGLRADREGGEKSAQGELRA